MKSRILEIAAAAEWRAFSSFLPSDLKVLKKDKMYFVELQTREHKFEVNPSSEQ